MDFEHIELQELLGFMAATKGRQSVAPGEVWPLKSVGTRGVRTTIYFAEKRPMDTHFAFVVQNGEVMVAAPCLVDGRARCVQASEFCVTYEGRAEIYFISSRTPFLPEGGVGNTEELWLHLFSNAEKYWVYHISN